MADETILRISNEILVWLLWREMGYSRTGTFRNREMSQTFKLKLAEKI